MGKAAVNAAKACGYTNAGTVEFILGEDGKYYFLEMNTRLQVEHPITELTAGLDIVREQVRMAEGEKLSFTQEDITRRGHAIECRIYAEDVYNGFLPDTGTLKTLREPVGNGVRVDSAKVPLDRHYTDGVSFFYYIREASRKADGARTTMSVPIVVDTVRSTVDLTINEKREDCKVTAFKYPLEAYKMSGHINFTGFFGVTGDFTGWMSADSAEVPLKANVSVILGSVVVKLKDARRAGWIPQRSND
jgi:biotin carboxylase